jgi:hypothetical protein
LKQYKFAFLAQVKNQDNEIPPIYTLNENKSPKETQHLYYIAQAKENLTLKYNDITKILLKVALNIINQTI